MLIDKEIELNLKKDLTPILDIIKEMITNLKIENANILCMVPHEVSSLVYLGWEDGLEDDFKDFVKDIVPENKYMKHDEPGTSYRYNFFEHMRAKLIGNTETTLIVKGGELYMGKYQNLYFYSPIYNNIPNQKLFLRIQMF